MLVAVFALGLGAIVRSTAAGIAVFAGIFFVIPPLLDILPASWNDAISKYLPSEAGRQLFSLHQGAHALSPLWGGLLLLGYCASGDRERRRCCSCAATPSSRLHMTARRVTVGPRR